MSAAVINLEVEQGASFRFVYKWSNPDNTPILLHGCKARSQWRESVDSTDVLIELTTENGRIEIVPDQGLVTLKLTSQETSALTFSTATYDIEVVFDEYQGEVPVVRLARGKVKLSKEITR